MGGALFLGGCAGYAEPVPEGAPGTARAADGKPVGVPFAYHPLGVRNSCFVESVRFYDEYRTRQRGGENGWVKVLQWGHLQDEAKVGLGHAVAVFTLGDKVWTYDINKSFSQLSVAADRRADLTDVTPEIFSRYPEHKAVLPRYREDFGQGAVTKVPEYLFYHASPDVREATKVASELGRYRPVRVVEFKYTEDGQPKVGAATAFIFGNRLCLYLPAKGTQIADQVRTMNPEELRLIELMLRQMYKGGLAEVRWQPGGYWFYPPKS